MLTHQIHVSDGKARVHDIRIKLFAFPEVLDVFVTGRPDLLIVVYWGRPRPAEWLRALRTVGYNVAQLRRTQPTPINVEPVQVVLSTVSHPGSRRPGAAILPRPGRARPLIKKLPPTRPAAVKPG